MSGVIVSPEVDIPANSVITITLTDSITPDAPSIIKKQYNIFVPDSVRSVPFQLSLKPEFLFRAISPGISARAEKDSQLILTSHKIVQLAKETSMEKLTIILQ